MHGNSWNTYARNLWGSNWAVCQANAKNKARYDRCISRIEFLEGREKYFLEYTKELQARVTFLENQTDLGIRIGELEAEIRELEKTESEAKRELEAQIKCLEIDLERTQEEFSEIEQKNDILNENITWALVYARTKNYQDTLIHLERAEAI